MDDLDKIRLRVQELLAKGSEPNLSAEQKSLILDEVNMLWSKIAIMSKQQASGRMAVAPHSTTTSTSMNSAR